MKAFLLIAAVSAVSASAQMQVAMAPAVKACSENTNFSRWKEDLRKEAMASGISSVTWDAAEPDLVVNSKILALDKRQGGFYKSFLDFALPRVHSRLQRARALKQKYGTVLNNLEKKYGVPGSVLLSFWGMETDFATQPARKGLYPVLQSMTTLAYDCRRSDLFRGNLIDALKLLERGDVSVDSFNGEWAGETSGLQFTPSLIYKYGVSYSGAELPDTVNKVEDMFATAANVFKNYGWRAGEPITQEVILPDNFPWEAYAQSDFPLKVMKITHSVSYWAKLGVTGRTASLPSTNLQAALVLPLGAKGPAFLAYPNFNAMMTWNNSLNNALTASYFASRLDNPRTPEMSHGKEEVYYLNQQEMTELQSRLAQRGYDIDVDGRLGTGTRLAVRDVQLKARSRSLPPDGYPSLEMLEYLRGR
jgi:lytic murein transglycosylase